jgi:Protein of unknown function (DUF2971)
MISHLYRYRPANALLDGFEELAKQEIYFSSPEDLNDPMEGYKDVFWSGDRIVWRNLLRHYLLCLLKTTAVSLMAGTDFDRAILKTMIFSAYQDLPETRVRVIYQRACEAFIADSNIQQLIEALAHRVTPLRRDELTHTLRAVHPFALNVLFKEWRHESIDGFFRDLDTLRTHAAAMKEAIARVAAMKPPEQEAAEVIFAGSELMVAQMELIQDSNSPPPPESHALIFVTRDFPASYVQALDELIHPACFLACFVANPSDASMWGTYGDGHTGVCLKFKAAADSEGRPALDLNGINGWRGGGGMAPEPIRSFHRRAFYKVNYSESYPEIDFFNSLGRLPIPLLNAVWYNGDGDERSTCHSTRSLDTDEWRKKYWEAFQSGAICKTSEWAHEQEYRLLLWSSLADLKDKPSRKLQYKFSDLSGIIFGAKTATEDKLKILKIVEDKCRAEKRTDFEFHQAQYSRKDRGFKIAPLSLIRLQ